MRGKRRGTTTSRDAVGPDARVEGRRESHAPKLFRHCRRHVTRRMQGLEVLEREAVLSVMPVRSRGEVSGMLLKLLMFVKLMND